jgi:hypothetical protein
METFILIVSSIKMNKERYIQQVRADLIYAKAERCKTPKMALLEDSLLERFLGVATIGAYQAYKTTKIYHLYNEEHRQFIECVEKNQRLGHHL